MSHSTDTDVFTSMIPLSEVATTTVGPTYTHSSKNPLQIFP